MRLTVFNILPWTHVANHVRAGWSALAGKYCHSHTLPATHMQVLHLFLFCRPFRLWWAWGQIPWNAVCRKGGLLGLGTASADVRLL